ncbi:MAG: NAD(P)-binding domain-containing protein [Bryobacterales bacterium]|nr:NAD(P)-binding domain-containing protein [Bryobacterales bacterium]
MSTRRPQLGSHFESNVPGLHIIGDLAGAPVVKLAMAQGAELAEYLASERSGAGFAFDVVVIGAGAAGLNCALVAQAKGLRVMVLEKAKLANTIEEFPEGKWVYAEPDAMQAKGRLWFAEGASKEELLRRWQANVTESGLDVRTGEAVTGVARKDGGFEVRTERGVYQARRVVLATGQRGNPRRLGVPGEDGARVHHRLYGVSEYEGEDIVVVGGGNSAVEAAVALSAKNRVTLSYRGDAFGRVFAENRRLLEQAVDAGRIRVVMRSRVARFEDGAAVMDGGEAIPCTRAFVLIGADAPVAFLRSLGIRMENDWNWRRYALLAFSFLIAYSIYGVKRGPGVELWPFTGWGYEALTLVGRPPSFWYTVLYTAVMTVFGLQAMKRWGFDKKDRFQIWRYTSLIGFQWVFFFLIPEFLFQYAMRYEWLGEALARDPAFAQNAWRSYGLVYAWPLFFHTFLGSPHQFWTVWGVVLAFVLIPLLVLFHGKRYCSWICGCGGLAETLGDRWRHLAPKGRASIQWERMGTLVLLAATVFTLWPSATARNWYGLVVDLWLVGIIPVTLYPFLGGKIWCRYWCPLARLMQMMGSVYTRARASRFAIHANEKCIACGECTRYCQVGIDVMQYALKQQPIDNANSSCIGCGICVTVCPMGTLSFAAGENGQLVQIAKARVAS